MLVLVSTFPCFPIKYIYYYSSSCIPPIIHRKTYPNALHKSEFIRYKIRPNGKLYGIFGIPNDAATSFLLWP